MRWILLMLLCAPVYIYGFDADTNLENESFSKRIPQQSEEVAEFEEEYGEKNKNQEYLETRRNTLYDFLYKRLQQDADGKTKKKALTPNVYMIPGPQEPLPGRSHLGDYWPVFPFHNQFSGGLDLDPSISRHIGGDMNIAVPSWGMLDIYGRFFNRIHDTTTKFGYLNHPVNMLDLEKEDFVRLMNNPSLQYNRNAQPRVPLGKLARSYVPINCKPPMCNPYHMNFGFGVEHDYGGNDGVEGDIDVPIPISKGVAYRFPFSGKIYAFRDNITVTYGHNIAPIDPFTSLFEYQKHRDPELAIPRNRRCANSGKIWLTDSAAATYRKHLETNGKLELERSGSQKYSNNLFLLHDSLKKAFTTDEVNDVPYDVTYQNAILYNPYIVISHEEKLLQDHSYSFQMIS